MRLRHTLVNIFIDVQLQRNLEVKGHAGCNKFLHYTMAHLYTNEKKIINRKLNFPFSLYHTQDTNMTKHNSFYKTVIMYSNIDVDI